MIHSIKLPYLFSPTLFFSLYSSPMLSTSILYSLLYSSTSDSRFYDILSILLFTIFFLPLLSNTIYITYLYLLLFNMPFNSCKISFIISLLLRILNLRNRILLRFFPYSNLHSLISPLLSPPLSSVPHGGRVAKPLKGLRILDVGSGGGILSEVGIQFSIYLKTVLSLLHVVCLVINRNLLYYVPIIYLIIFSD